MNSSRHRSFSNSFQSSEIDGDVLLLITAEDVSRRLGITGPDGNHLISLLRKVQNPEYEEEPASFALEDSLSSTTGNGDFIRQ